MITIREALIAEHVIRGHRLVWRCLDGCCVVAEVERVGAVAITCAKGAPHRPARKRRRGDPKPPKGFQQIGLPGVDSDGQ